MKKGDLKGLVGAKCLAANRRDVNTRRQELNVERARRLRLLSCWRYTKCSSCISQLADESFKNSIRKSLLEANY